MSHEDHRIAFLLSVAKARAGAGRNREAAELLTSQGGIDLSAGDAIGPAARKGAIWAAEHFIKAHDLPRALEILESIGERDRAAAALRAAGELEWAREVARGAVSPSGADGATLESNNRLHRALAVYERAGQHLDAARVATSLGRLRDAGLHLEAAGLHFDAGLRLRDAGAFRESVEAFSQISTDDPRYREACVEAISISNEGDVNTESFDLFLVPFLVSGPQDDSERVAFETLASLYVAQGAEARAADVFRALNAPSQIPEGAPSLEFASEESDSASPPTEPVAMSTVKDVIPQAVLQGQEIADLSPPAGSGLIDDMSEATVPDMPAVGVETQGGPEVADTMITLAEEFRGEPTVKREVAFDERLAYADRLTPVVGMGPLATLKDAPRPSIADPADPPRTDGDPFEIDRVVAGRYRIEAQIGRGGVAAVYRATDLELDEPVALKVFKGAKLSDTQIARFRQELRVARQIQHPNVIRLHDIGIESGQRYISMELLSGSTIANMMGICRTGDPVTPLPIRRAVDFLIQACAGLQAAHDRGVVHRDVKLDNVFVTGRDTVKIMDFGIAKQRCPRGVSPDGRAAGTPEYMAPEQFQRFSDVTPAADVYSLGVCAYEMCTGRLPFYHPEVVALLLKHLQETPVPLRHRNPAVPAAVESVILRMLAKHPSDRFESCRLIEEALGRVRNSL